MLGSSCERVMRTGERNSLVRPKARAVGALGDAPAAGAEIHLRPLEKTM